jgi:hypothetical protein
VESDETEGAKRGGITVRKRSRIEHLRCILISFQRSSSPTKRYLVKATHLDRLGIYNYSIHISLRGDPIGAGQPHGRRPSHTGQLHRPSRGRRSLKRATT